jgi:hypothetical protein
MLIIITRRSHYLFGLLYFKFKLFLDLFKFELRICKINSTSDKHFYYYRIYIAIIMIYYHDEMINDLMIRVNELSNLINFNYTKKVCHNIIFYLSHTRFVLKDIVDNHDFYRSLMYNLCFLQIYRQSTNYSMALFVDFSQSHSEHMHQHRYCYLKNFLLASQHFKNRQLFLFFFEPPMQHNQNYNSMFLKSADCLILTILKVSQQCFFGLDFHDNFLYK